LPSGCTCEVSLEGSTDGDVWVDLDTVVVAEDLEHSVVVDLDRPLLRAVVRLSGTTFPVATCYLVGTLVRRRE
jgi:hypothetical protein